MTAYLLAVATIGFLLGGPFWMHYERRCAQQAKEWEARRRAREMRR